MAASVTSVKAWLMGKKTYLIAVSGLLTAVIAWSSGTIDNKTFVQDVFAATVATSVRGAIGKLEGE